MKNEKTPKRGLLIGLLLIIILLIAIIGLMAVLLLHARHELNRSYKEQPQITETTGNTEITENTEGYIGESLTTEDGLEQKKEDKENSKAPVIVLSDEELMEVSDMLNSMKYYGFCQSEYIDGSWIDWDKVFYSGAGIQQGDVSDEQINTYLKYVDQEELFTELIMIPGDALKTFVEETSGYPYEEANRPLVWTYMSEYDLYACQHGDTNYMEVTVLKGERKGQEYTIRYMGYDESYQESEMEIVFVREGDTYRFISNGCVTE